MHGALFKVLGYGAESENRWFLEGSDN
jgi:hypothetical protein